MNAFAEHHEDSIRFGYRCFDRLLLHGAIQPFQQPERVVGFFNTYRHLYPVSRDVLRGIATDYQRWVEQRARVWGAPILPAPEGRRDEFVEPYFRRAKPDQVAVILKAREPARILIAIGNPRDNRWHLAFAQRWVMQYNFYVHDREWGRLFVRMCPYFPFSGIGRYETAWMILHKLRRATVDAAREPLRGKVELDETWVGGTQAGLRGSRQLKGRKAALVLVSVERRGRASGRVRMEVIPHFAGATIRRFVASNIAVGPTVYTDGLKSFEGLPASGYKHVPRSQPTQLRLRQGAKSVVPLADRAIGNLKQWLIGTHHGVSRGQLQVYLDEFVFRYNRRKKPMAAFQTLLGLGSGRTATPYRRIRGASDLAKPNDR